MYLPRIALLLAWIVVCAGCGTSTFQDGGLNADATMYERKDVPDEADVTLDVRMDVADVTDADADATTNVPMDVADVTDADSVAPDVTPSGSPGCVGDQEPNDTPNLACTVAIGSLLQGRVEQGTADVADCFRFNVEANVEYTLSVRTMQSTASGDYPRLYFNVASESGSVLVTNQELWANQAGNYVFTPIQSGEARLCFTPQDPKALFVTIFASISLLNGLLSKVSCLIRRRTFLNSHAFAFDREAGHVSQPNRNPSV